MSPPVACKVGRVTDLSLNELILTLDWTDVKPHMEQIITRAPGAPGALVRVIFDELW